MNQDYNNLNQGNNGVPNNQPLNNSFNNTYNQPQVENNMYQQQVNPATQQFQNNVNNQYNQNFQQPGNQYQQVNSNAYQQPVQPNKPKKSKLGLILAIIGGIVVAVVILFIVIFTGVSATSDKLICKSDQGNITIMYNKNGLTGYKTVGMTYEYEQQKELAKQIGVDEYISEFNEWFITNTTGSCTINGKKIEKSESNDNNSSNNNNSTTTDVKTIGDSKYGYVDVPSNWAKFVDVDGNDSIQYSYANVYIVSLNMLDGNYSAETYASNYMYNKQNSSEVTGVTGATVKIGKNNEYTAYQVYMYYPADATYLVTYWFEAEDGNVHYIALEGPASVTDYLSIPQSFRLKK